MKQLFRVFTFDIRNTFKDIINSYMVFTPLIILIVLRLFIPSVESSSSTLAVVDRGEHGVDSALIAELDRFAVIKTYGSVADMEKKLRGTGSAEGLYRDPVKDQYVSVMERNLPGNTFFSFAAPLIRQHYYRNHYPGAGYMNTFIRTVPEELRDRSALSPVSTMGGSVFMVLMTIICGFMIGLGIVNDKESGTMMALRITPLSKGDYYLGKSLFPFLLVLAYTILALLMLGLIGVNILQVYIITLISYVSTILFGLLIGAVAGNENEAIGIGKMLSMLVMLSILGGTLLPQKWQWIVMWSPYFWTYNALESIFTSSIVWLELFWKSALILGTSGVFFLLFNKKIRQGLS
ncbi:MAG: ABC transporter permease [Candidatus Neomarinimicrobiota bacterium]|jgi:ABC-2 type transport system permease protein|nr:ABC transporter permease [Candidatus Neomarinimicrobiota bacterium]MDD3965593.1 ABC transporter permease [Candidatus Neomarinimicrobiota bacterium]MDX9779425.1 ABC transporter permease [bacterium]